VPHAYVKEMLDVEVLGEGAKEKREKVKALVYVDRGRTGAGVCKEEYVARMNRGVRDATRLGMSESYGEWSFYF